MLDGGWPQNGERPPLVQVDELRVAAASRDVAGIAAALEGHDVSEVLQRAGSAVLVALHAAPDWVSSLAISLVQRLELRSLPGDEELAQDLLTAVQGEPPPGRPLPVDLEELSGLLEGGPGQQRGRLPGSADRGRDPRLHDRRGDGWGG